MRLILQSPAFQPSACAAIIVNYNNAVDTLECLDALCGLPDRPGRIIVADNGSGKNVIGTILRGWSGICQRRGLQAPILAHASTSANSPHILLPLGENLGFGRANNAALNFLLKSTTPLECAAFWLLNNDALPNAGALAALCAKLDLGYALAGSTLVVAADGKTLQTAAGGEFSRWLGATSFIFSGKNLGEALRENERSAEEKMAYVDAASLIFRRELLNHRKPLFTERFFLYYEDVELGLWARRNGHRLGWARDSVVRHKWGASVKREFDGKAAKLKFMALRNRLFCLGEYYPASLPIAGAYIIYQLCCHILSRIARKFLFFWKKIMGR